MKKVLKYLACVSCISLLALTSCSSAKDTIIDEEPYSFTQRVFTNVDVDSQVKLDGIVDEDFYNNCKWFTKKYETATESFDFKMTTCFFDKGFVVAFEVGDPNSHTNEFRESYTNSGIELYLGLPGATSLKYKAYEIDIIPINEGKITTRKHNGSSYNSFVNNWSREPLMAYKGIDAPINSEDNNGYVIETYFSYDFFDLNTKPDYFYLCPTLLRTYSSDISDTSREWYNFGEQLKGGWDWNSPATWWKFNATGYDCYVVDVECGQNGSYEIDSNMVDDGGSAKIVIKPEDGYCIEDILVSNESKLNNLVYENNQCVLKISNIKGDIKVKITFAKLTESKYQVNGSVKFAGQVLTEEMASDLRLVFNMLGTSYGCDLNNDGTYSMILPEGKYLVQIYSKKGYLVTESSLEVTAAASHDFEIKIDEYGDNKKVKLNDALITSPGGQAQFFNNDLLCIEMTNTFAISMKWKYSQQLCEDGKVIDDPTYGTVANSLICINMPFWFYTESGDFSGGVQLQVVHWNTAWRLKINSDGGFNEGVMSYEQLSKFCGDGLDVTFLRQSNNYYIYADDGTGKMIKMAEYSYGDMNSYLKYVDLKFQDSYGEYTLEVFDNYFSLNKTISDME